VVYEAYNAAGFGGSLDGTSDQGVANTWTVFAPSNAVLEAAGLTAADLDADTLRRHIVTTASLPTADLANETMVTSNIGGAYEVEATADGITVGGFAVTEITTGQSTVYQIDGVLP